MEQAVRRVLSKYATFSGRASRPEFWWWMLAAFVVIALAGVLDRAVMAPLLGFSAADENAGQPLTTILSLVLLLPNISVAVRRLHDGNRTGWWLLIALVPILGALVLVYFYIQPSDTGRNGFGDPDPLPG